MTGCYLRRRRFVLCLRQQRPLDQRTSRLTVFCDSAGQPVKVRLAAVGNRERENLGYVVLMNGPDGRFHIGIAFRGRLDDSAPFLGRFQLSLPSVGTRHRATDLHAASESALKEMPADLGRALLRGGGCDDVKEISHCASWWLTG